MSRRSFNQLLISREFGGAAEVAFRIAGDIQRRAPGAARLWLPGEGRAMQKAREWKLPVRQYTPPDIARGSRPHRAWANLLCGMKLRGQRPGILHVHATLLYAALPIACAFSGLKRIVHVHLQEEPETFRWAFRRPPEMIVTCGKFLVEQVRRALPPQQRQAQAIVAVPNCIDTERYFPGDRQQAKQAVGAWPDRPLVLMLANLAPHKGQPTALRAVAELKRRGIDVACWLAGVERDGDGAFTAGLQTMIEELGIGDRARLLGFRDDGPELLRAADFFLLPSTREGLPLSILEAQASKVAVLASPVDGIPEVVEDGRTGFLVSPDQPAAYAERLEQLIADPELYRSITHHAHRQCVTHHNSEAYCQTIWSLYDQLLEDRRAA